MITAVGAALASSGPSALGAYLVASAVDVGIAEGAAGALSAAGSASSLVVRILVGHRADRRRDYGFSTMVALLVAGAGGFALLAVGQPAPFVAGVFVAFALGWGWPGLFNLAVVDLHREAPGAATGISQSRDLRGRGRRPGGLRPALLGDRIRGRVGSGGRALARGRGGGCVGRPGAEVTFTSFGLLVPNRGRL